MEIQLRAGQQAQLERMASESGVSVNELVREILDRYLAEEARFQSAVQEGLDAAERGDFVPTSEVWAGIECLLKS
jgi:predicted transcriptional regulator